MTTKTKNTSGPIDTRSLTTYGRKGLGESIQVRLCSWDLNARKAIPGMTEFIIQFITQSLSEGKAVRLKKLGCLSPSFKTARPGRNPQTLEDATISARWTVTLRNSCHQDALAVVGWTDMVNALVESYGDKPEFTFNKDMARDVLGAFIQQIIMIEKGGTRIEIRKLGAFYPSFIKGQVRRNPKTGDAVQTQDKIVVRFKTSSLLQDKLNQAERVPQSA